MTSVTHRLTPHRELPFKRKFEDALYNLDKAVEPLTSQPVKKTKFSHSVYSTLAKYGIKKDAMPYVQEVTLDVYCPTSTLALVDMQQPPHHQDLGLKAYRRLHLTSSFC